MNVTIFYRRQKYVILTNFLNVPPPVWTRCFVMQNAEGFCEFICKESPFWHPLQNGVFETQKGSSEALVMIFRLNNYGFLISLRDKNEGCIVDIVTKFWWVKIQSNLNIPKILSLTNSFLKPIVMVINPLKLIFVRILMLIVCFDKKCILKLYYFDRKMNKSYFIES